MSTFWARNRVEAPSGGGTSLHVLAAEGCSWGGLIMARIDPFVRGPPAREGGKFTKYRFYRLLNLKNLLQKPRVGGGFSRDFPDFWRSEKTWTRLKCGGQKLRFYQKIDFSRFSAPPIPRRGPPPKVEKIIMDGEARTPLAHS